MLCVDAFQFTDGPAAAREIARLLRPGGRAAITCWAPRANGAEVPQRHAAADPVGALRAAGLVADEEEHPEWMPAQRRVFELALAEGDPGDDEALRALQAEATTMLAVHDDLRRLLVLGHRPASAAPGPPPRR